MTQPISPNELEQSEQIPDLKIPKAALVKDEEVAVVLFNMGGPKINADVKPFLTRLFNDPLILRFPMSSLLQPFFAWLMVTFRGKATQERYQLIGGGSPIFDSTEKQVKALKDELKRRGRNLDVSFCFNYSEPLPEGVIESIKAAGKKYILPVSLYPHYSKATTGSNLHYLKEAAQKIYPEVQFLNASEYYLNDSYIEGFVDRIKESIKPGESLDDFYLMFSAHGLPLYFLIEGDPYPYQIHETTVKIIERLKRRDKWAVCFQSAVGPIKWLKPTTEGMIKILANRGQKKLLVIPVAFVSDHIETICEIDIEYRHTAQGAGVTDFRMSRALECHSGFIQALADSVEASLGRPAAQTTKPAPQFSGIR